MAFLTLNGLLTLKGYKFYNKMHIKCNFVKFQTFFSQDLLLIGCDIFPQVMVKHILLCFSTLVAQPVCILGAKLWKAVMKIESFMFIAFLPFF